MNERIFELAKEAKIKFTHEFTHDPTEKLNRAFVECWKDELERFAKLIVTECVGICKEISNANISDLQGSPEFGAGAYFSAERIEQHFGVEE